MSALKKLQNELDESNEKQKNLEQKLTERRKNMYSLAILLNNLDDTLEEGIITIRIINFFKLIL